MKTKKNPVSDDRNEFYVNALEEQLENVHGATADKIVAKTENVGVADCDLKDNVTDACTNIVCKNEVSESNFFLLRVIQLYSQTHYKTKFSL